MSRGSPHQLGTVSVSQQSLEMTIPRHVFVNITALSLKRPGLSALKPTEVSAATRMTSVSAIKCATLLLCQGSSILVFARYPEPSPTSLRDLTLYWRHRMRRTSQPPAPPDALTWSGDPIPITILQVYGHVATLRLPAEIQQTRHFSPLPKRSYSQQHSRS